MAARAIVLAASNYGISPPDLCAKVGLDPAAVADVDGRVPASVMVALWREVAPLLERHAEALLAKLPPRGTLPSAVRAAMTPLLAGGDVTIDRVASAIGASPRSIQRRLREEGTSFQRVLDELRKEVATEYLRERVHSIAEVALLLGFSDQTAFHRAFVRWTGRTPGDVRRGVRT